MVDFDVEMNLMKSNNRYSNMNAGVNMASEFSYDSSKAHIPSISSGSVTIKDAALKANEIVSMAEKLSKYVESVQKRIKEDCKYSVLAAERALVILEEGYSTKDDEGATKTSMLDLIQSL